MTHDQVVAAYFAAMRQGASGGAELFALFTDDAVYSEPFSELPPAEGIDAIRTRFRLGWQQPMPDLELDVLALLVEGDTATARWECRSAALPGPVQGEDRYHFVDGRIARLDVRILPPPNDRE